MTDDPNELIVEAIQTAINAIQEDQLTSPFRPLSFQCLVPEDFAKELERESSDLRVVLAPFGETEEKKGRGGEVLVQYGVTLAIVAKLNSQLTRRTLNSLMYSIRKFLRGKLMAGYTWTGGETNTKFDPRQISKRNFVSASLLNYVGMES